MGNDLTVYLRIKDLMSKSLIPAAGRVEKFASKVSHAFTRLARLPALVGGISLGLIGRYFIDAAAKVEVFRNQLIAVSETSAKATYALAAIREFARTSPLETEDVVQSYVRLRAVGMDPTIEQMRTMGGVAVLFNKDLTAVLDSFIGLNKRTLRQVGIEIDRTGSKAIIQSGNIRKVVGKDSTSIRRAVLETWAERFPDAMKIAGNSFKSQMSIMRSNMRAFAVSLAETFLPEIRRVVEAASKYLETLRDRVVANKDKIIAKVQKTAAEFRKWFEVLRKIGGWLLSHWKTIAMVGVAAKLIEVAGAVVRFTIALKAMNLALLANPIVLVTAAIAGLGVVFVKTFDQWKSWRDDMVDNAALEAKARQVQELTALLGLYDQMLDNVEVRQESGRQVLVDLGTASGALRGEIADLEDQMGEYGLALEGGLLQRQAAVEERLRQLTQVAKDTREEMAKPVSFGTGDLGPPEPGKPAEPSGFGIGSSRLSMNDRLGVERHFANERKAILADVNEYGMGLERSSAEAVRNTLVQRQDMWESYRSSIVSGFQGMWSTITDIHASAQDRMQSLADQLYRTMTNFIWQYISEFISAKVAEAATDRAVSAQKQANAISNTALSGASAAVSAGESVAGIPYAGPALAIAAIATVAAVVFALISKAQSYRSGTIDAPGGLAFLHRDEMVQLPQHAKVFNAQRTREMFGNGSGTVVNLNINGSIEQSAVRPVQNELARVGRSVTDAIRGGYVDFMQMQGARGVA